MAEPEQTETKADFARRLKVSKARVTQWAKAGL